MSEPISSKSATDPRREGLAEELDLSPAEDAELDAFVDAHRELYGLSRPPLPDPYAEPEPKHES